VPVCCLPRQSVSVRMLEVVVDCLFVSLIGVLQITEEKVEIAMAGLAERTSSRLPVSGFVAGVPLGSRCPVAQPVPPLHALRGVEGRRRWRVRVMAAAVRCGQHTTPAVLPRWE
jgi:hypothetical protein